MHKLTNSHEPERLTKLHWRIVITAGMGFFTDAYDLFVIGVVTAILMPIWHLDTQQLAFLNGASLAAAALGAVLFGILSDKFGRRKFYGLEVLILFVGAILSACSTSYTMLLISRVIVGFGIGADYPSSAVVASEYSTHKNRGFLVLLVFAMQALGLIVGPMLAAILLMTPLSHDWIWRLLLGLGAIPAASVFYLRRRIAETPKYLLTQPFPYEVSRVVSDLTGHGDQPRLIFKQQCLLSRKWLTCLFGTAGAWFLLDVAFYGNGISSILIIDKLSPHSDLASHTLISALLFLFFAVPGYLLAAKYIDRVGRKLLQNMGFFMMAVTYFALAFLPIVRENIFYFVFVFGISFFFVNFGPNSTTFLIPSEIYPTNIRARAHGISAAVGKLGAFVGAFFMPIVLQRYGFPVTLALMGGISLAGILTSLLIPEMKHQSLDSTEITETHRHAGTAWPSPVIKA